MPQHASAKKRMKTNARDRATNRSVKALVRRATQSVRQSLDGADVDEKLRAAQSQLDKASKKGVIPKRTADRKKARLAIAVHKAAQAKTAAN